MKLNKSIMALATAAAFGISGQAFAAGTPAGETVSNTVKLDYKVSGVDQNTVDDIAEFIVDNVIDMTFTTALSGASTIVPGAALSPTYTLVNDGNKAQSFRFDLTESTSQFSAPSISALNVVSGVCSIGGTSPIKTITMNPDVICEFTADLTFPTKMAAGLVTDDNIVNGDTFILRSAVTAVTDVAGTTAEETSDDDKNAVAFLNAQELTVLGEEDATVTAPHTAYDGVLLVDTGTITVSTANFEGANGLDIEVKVVNDFICDATYDAATLAYGKYNTPGMGTVTCDDNTYTPKAIPGALVEYTLTATNEGPVAAVDATFKQAIADMLYDNAGTPALAMQAGTIANPDVTFSDGAIIPDITNDGSNLSVKISSFGTSENITITFTAIVE